MDLLSAKYKVQNQVLTRARLCWMMWSLVLHALVVSLGRVISWRCWTWARLVVLFFWARTITESKQKHRHQHWKSFKDRLVQLTEILTFALTYQMQRWRFCPVGLCLWLMLCYRCDLSRVSGIALSEIWNVISSLPVTSNDFRETLIGCAMNDEIWNDVFNSRASSY